MRGHSPLGIVDVSPKALGDSYLEFQIDEETKAVLPMTNVQEVLTVDINTVVPVPSMPSCILGLLSHRSRVYWTVNLPQMLNLQPLQTNTQYILVILQVGQTTLALAVAEVQGIVKLVPKQIQIVATQTSPSGLLTYVRGCVITDDAIAYLLDPTDLAKASVLRT